MKTYIALLAVLVAGITGCANPDAARQVKRFSDATILTADNLTRTFRLVEDNHFNEEVSVSILDFDRRPGFEPCEIRPFMDAQAFRMRLDILEGLKSYAADLSAVTGDSSLAAFDQETTRLGKALNDVDTNLVSDVFFKSVPATSQDLRIFTTAINALGHRLITHRQQNEARQAIASMQQPVADICRLLQTDLDILSQQFSNDCSQVLINKNQYVLNHLDAFNHNPGEKEAAVREMAGLAVKNRNDAAIFESMKSAVAKLAAVNGALGEVFSNDKTNVTSLLNDLNAESERIRRYYESLSAIK